MNNPPFENDALCPACTQTIVDAEPSASSGATILAHGRVLPCDTIVTGLNNNMLVLGPSGSGKTRHVLKPNLLQMNASYIVLDTKGTLCREVGPVLAAHGYHVQRLNLSDLNALGESRDAGPAQRKNGGSGSAGADPAAVASVGYDPLAHIRRDADGRPNQQDIISIAKALCPIEDNNQPFWDHAASNLLACLIAYTAETLPAPEQHMGSVISLVDHLSDGATGKLLDELTITRPDSLSCALWRRYSITQAAERMHASIVGIVAEKIMTLGIDSALRLYTHPRQVDFGAFSQGRRALFVTISDIDRSMDRLANLVVMQAFTSLMRQADASPRGSLVYPVRFFLDDFANLNIPDIDGILSVVRSRNIWCTLLLQSVNQLEAQYGRARAMSIMGNCDTQLVLAFQDIESARMFSERADKTPSSLFSTPLCRSWLFLRGSRGELVERFALEDHPLYPELPEAHMHTAYGRDAAFEPAEA